MRVIGGEFRSRRLKTLPGLATRPTPDRLRETLFDVLADRVAGAVFLDAYAGTGAVGIEALSRGARRAILLEKSPAALRVIRENIAALGLQGSAEVVEGPVLTTIARRRADIAFLDPPYQAESQYAVVMRLLAQAPPPLAIVQHSKFFELAPRYGALERARVIRQGDNALSFFAARE